MIVVARGVRVRARRRSLRDWRGGAAAARGQWRRGHVTHPAPRAARTPTPCLQIIIIPLAGAAAAAATATTRYELRTAVACIWRDSVRAHFACHASICLRAYHSRAIDRYATAELFKQNKTQRIRRYDSRYDYSASATKAPQVYRSYAIS